MKCVKINYTDSIDNFFFEDDYMNEEDVEVEYYEDITIPDNTWDDVDSNMENKENIYWNVNTQNYRGVVKDDIPILDPEDFSLNSLNMRENSEQLINNFLDLDNPELSPKMRELMKMHDFMKIFIHKITRVPDAVLYNEEEINQGFSIDESVFRKRECSDIVLMKRSYNAFRVLTSSSILDIVVDNAKFIGKELLKIFHQKSEGNFNHFKPLWNHLIEYTHGEIALLLTSDEYKEPPIYQMLRYIHEPAITSSLISTIFLFDARPGLQIELFKKLQEMEFIETLLAMLDMKDFPVIVQATSSFLIQMIEEGSKTEDSNILLAPIQLDPSCLSVIIKHISEETSPVHQHSCIQLLLAFLEKCIYTSDNVSLTTSSFVFSDKMPLEGLKKSVLKYLKYNIDELCVGITGIKNVDRDEDEFLEEDEEEEDEEEEDDDEEEEEEEEAVYEDEEEKEIKTNANTNIKYHSSTIKNSNKKLNQRLTVSKIDLLKIIITTIKELRKDEYEMLEFIPWKLLVDWFFQNSSNNVYHNIFFKFFEFALKSNYIPILNSLFIENNLINQFIDNFNIPRYIDCKGYIILMCNHIRFTYETQPNSVLKSVLENNKKWEEFLILLKKATKEQIGDKEKFEYIGNTRPLPYAPKLATHKYLAQLIRKDKELKHVDGVELDSLYAALLGYGVNEEKKKEKQLKKNIRTYTKYQPISRRSSTAIDLDLISEPNIYDNYQESNTKSLIISSADDFNQSLVIDHSKFLFNKKSLISYEI